MSTLAARKNVELQEKLASLQSDFAAWSALAESENATLRLHKSQIEKLTRTLGRLASDFKHALPAAVPSEVEDETFLGQARNVENMILALLSIWAFFRKKLAQRLEPGFGRFLDAADELAWTCYEPALMAAGIAATEPPLVFLNGARSPFMVARDDAYVPEDLPPRFLALDDFRGIVSHLPVPVIGLPWAQVGHLPDILTVAHEAGHVVEDDLNLADELDGVIKGLVSESRREQWLDWRGEIFADLWACAALGPAFVSTLCDFLAADPLRSAEEDGGQKSYPPPDLRVWLNLEALRLADFEPKTAGPLQTLTALWPTAAAQDETEAAAVVHGLLKTSLAGLGNKCVHDIFGPFRPNDFGTAEEAFYALKGGQLDLRTRNVRVIFAGVRQGYDENPGNWRGSGIAERLLARFDRNISAGSLLGTGFRGVKNLPPSNMTEAKIAERMIEAIRRLIPKGRVIRNGTVLD
jgi:hypothetical protein